jgi:hypothetical protein
MTGKSGDAVGHILMPRARSHRSGELLAEFFVHDTSDDVQAESLALHFI